MLEMTTVEINTHTRANKHVMKNFLKLLWNIVNFFFNSAT